MKKTSLTDAEWRLMQIMWDNGPCTLPELTRAVKDDVGWSPNAIISFIKRLEVKDAVCVEGTRRLRKYIAVLPREEAILDETRNIMNKVYRGDKALFLKNVVETQDMSDDDIDEMIAMLKNVKGEK